VRSYNLTAATTALRIGSPLSSEFIATMAGGIAMKDELQPPTNTLEELHAKAMATHRTLAAAKTPYEEALQAHKIALFTLLDAVAVSGGALTEAEQKTKWDTFIAQNSTLFPAHDAQFCNMNYVINSCEWVNCMKTASGTTG